MRKQKACYIIAEAGVNHNGSIETAKQMIDAAVRAKADAIKFQSFITDEICLKNAPKAQYQERNTANENENQYQMLKRLELSFSQQQELYQYCQQQRIDFLSSPFDQKSCQFLLSELKLPQIKLGSGELSNAQLLLTIARSQTKLILSTGMSNLTEIKQALSVLAYGYLYPNQPEANTQLFKDAFKDAKAKKYLQQKVTLLHCTSDYPCPVTDVHLNALLPLKKQFNLNIGYSDHTQNYHISLAAVAMGAKVIEKHFTLDKKQQGPDHKASIEEKELTFMIKQIHDIEAAFGLQNKPLSKTEKQTKIIARKGIYASKKIKQGELLSEQNICLKRPANTTSGIYYWDLIGKKADKNYSQNEAIN